MLRLDAGFQLVVKSRKILKTSILSNIELVKPGRVEVDFGEFRCDYRLLHFRPTWEGGYIMVKADLINRLAEQRGLKRVVAQRAVDTLFDAMASALIGGEGIEIRGFASFKVKKYGGYQGRNPRTGQPIPVRPKSGVVFKPGAELRRRVNKSD